MSNIDAEGRTITSVSEMDKLNEAIAWARDMAYAGFCNLSLVEEQRYENIANWLEELKEMWKSQGQVGDFWYSKGYTKAIDDFFEMIMENCSMSNMNATMIRQIAEQLKAGVEE